MVTEDKPEVSEGTALPPSVLAILEIFSKLKCEEVKTFVNETFEPRPSDVIVTTFPKSGTTLVAHMCYQIAVLSGGYPPNDEDGESAEDFALQAPFLEFMALFDTKPSETTPRIFRSHLNVQELRSLKSRHVVVMRDPKKFPSSALNFVFEPLSEAGEKTDEGEGAAFRGLSEAILFGPSPESDKGLSGWHHSATGNTNMLYEDVLILFYEDIVDDYRSAIVKIADFMKCELSSEAVDTIVKRCDRQYMIERSAFLQHDIEKVFEKRYDFKYVMPESMNWFKRLSFNDEMEEKLVAMNMNAFGVETYAEFRARVTEEQKERFGR